MFQESEPALWDMRLLLYKLMREIWLEMTDGDPIGKMCSIMIFLLPYRLMDVSPDDINWVRDSLFDGW